MGGLSAGASRGPQPRAPPASVFSRLVSASPRDEGELDLLDHLIRPLQERRRDRQAEGLGGLEVDDKLHLDGPIDW